MTTAVLGDPISESELVTIWEIPFSMLYRADVKMPDGDTQTFEDVRAYTKMLRIFEETGHVEIGIGTRDSRSDRSRLKIPESNPVYPFHFLRNEVLCALKFNKMRMTNSFALNYDLFCSNVEWQTCMMFHVPWREDEAEPAVFISSRQEWLDKGVVETQGREVQIFLDVEEARHVPASIIQPICVPDISNWIDHCQIESDRRRKSNRR